MTQRLDIGERLKRGNDVQRSTPRQTPQPRSQSRATWFWVVIGLGLALIKNSLFAAFIHQPWGVVVLLVLAALSSLVRGKPAATALWAAPAVALLAGPSSVPAGIALGIGTFALLIALFLAIGTALRLAEARP